MNETKYKLGKKMEGSTLTPIKYLGPMESGNSSFLFRCDCGTIKRMRMSSVKQSIKRNQSTSCGCIRKAKAIKNLKKGTEISKSRKGKKINYKRKNKPWNKGKKFLKITYPNGEFKYNELVNGDYKI